jgi:hypothetical protein
MGGGYWRLSVSIISKDYNQLTGDAGLGDVGKWDDLYASRYGGLPCSCVGVQQIMAGFVSRKSADRWNRTASIVEGGGAGWHHVPGLYRPPQGSSGCPDGLAPGSYRAVAGGTIGPGETGPIIITGCDGEEMLDAVNQTECTFYLGNRITAFVDPCCNVHFTGCAGDVAQCCDRFIFVCVCGSSDIIALNGGVGTFDVSDCLGCEGASLEITMSCSDGVISADWELACGEDSESGTITGLSDLCDSEATQIETFIDGSLGFLILEFSNTATDCAGPDGPSCFCMDCPRYGVLFTISGLSDPGIWDCDCATINGSYLLRYPIDAISDGCSQITLTRSIPFSCAGLPETINLVLTAQITCQGTPIVIAFQGSARLVDSSNNIVPMIGSVTQNIALTDFQCPGQEYTVTNSNPVGTIDRCSANGATLTMKVV